MEDEQALRVITKIQCGGCQKYFSGNGAFEQHRIGPFESRRCMTTEEMQAAGMAWEYCLINLRHEDKRAKEKHEVWYDVAGREAVRAAFHKNEEEDKG